MGSMLAAARTQRRRSPASRRSWRVPARRMAVIAVGLISLACVAAGAAAATAAAAPPLNTFPPEVVGSARLGERLQCGAGDWQGAEEKSEEEHGPFEYEWVREGITVSPLAHKNLTYTLTKADEHLAVWCVVTAENKEGVSEPAESWNSVCLGGECEKAPEPPQNTAPPEVSGTPAVGQMLTCSQGTWSGSPPLTYTYRWLRDKEAIASATSSTYTVASEDEGHSLSCKVTATNSAGEASAISKNSLSIGGSKPEPREVPLVLGIPAIEQTLTCHEGVWSGSTPITFTFQWLRDGEVLAAQTGDTYYVEPADEGHKISCRVTGTNAAGKVSAASAAVAISIRPPTSTARPRVSGTPEEGHKLTCAPGTWTGSPTKYEYQWVREESPIASATSSEYTLVGADVGVALYCDVTATNAGGSDSRLSGPVMKQGKAPPVPTAKPEVSGLPINGQELNCSQGTWTGSPSRYEYQWVRDKGSAEETSLESGTASGYMVVGADEGHSLTCVVTAIGGEGIGEAESEPLGVAGEPPKNVLPPELSGGNGTLRVGESVTCVRGVWKGAPKPDFTYVWLRDGREISSATSSVYTVSEADRGHSLSCEVTATNSEGTASAGSEPPVHVPGSPPENIEPPKIEGSPTVGTTLTCTEGEWTGAPTPTFTYQWLLNNVSIPNATSNEYTVTDADRGHTLTCRVDAVNSEGPGVATSRPDDVPGVPPKDIRKPLVSGAAALGQTLTCQPGTWEGSPPPAFAYRWLRDRTAIASATESTYTVEPADQGHELSCVVEATNVAGGAASESANSLDIAARATVGTETPPAKTTSGSTAPSAAQILAALGTQLVRVQSKARLGSVRKAGGYPFALVPPAAGSLELVWYELAKGAHGKITRLIVAQAKASFPKALTKGMVRLRLTAQGRRAIRHATHIRLTTRATFRVEHGTTVSWLGTFVLRH